MDEQPADEPHQELGDEHVDVARYRRVHEAHHEEELGKAQARIEQRLRHQRRDDDEERVEDVVRGDDARAVRRLRPGLDQRIEWHREESPEEREQEKIRHHAPGMPVGQELADRPQIVVRHQSGHFGV